MDYPPTSAYCHDWARHHLQRYWRVVTAQLLYHGLLQECYGRVPLSWPFRLDHRLLRSSSLPDPGANCSSGFDLHSNQETSPHINHSMFACSCFVFKFSRFGFMMSVVDTHAHNAACAT